MRALLPLFALKALCLAVPAMLAAGLFASPAAAALSSCTISSAGIVFPGYNTVTRAAVDSVATVTVTCTGSGTEGNLSLNFTGGNTGSCSPREMRSGANALGYQLFRDPARSGSFCDGANRLDTPFDFSTGATQTRTYTVYGRVTANQNPPWGSYSDTLTLTLKRGGGTITSTSVPINGSVTPTCSVSAGTLSFGTYAPGTATTGTGTVSVNCSNGAPYQVSLGSGQNANGVTRRMASSGGGFLTYFLYSNPGRTTSWGDGGSLGGLVSGTGSGTAQNLFVYGRIPAGQGVPAGTYSDSVVVTVEY